VTDRFIKVACINDIRPGKMRCIRVGHRRLLIANVDGRFYATDDVCTHEDASLSSGSLKGTYVTCPLHGSRFDVRTGEALEEPAWRPLATYPVRLDGDDILLDLEPRDSISSDTNDQHT
jgi:3-phenylpropionate/trans-cinnamate dioxygenase ferredoxin subunit